MRSASVISRRTRQGDPTAITPAGMSRVTTLPAPITVLSPIVTPGSMVVPAPIQQLRQMCTGMLNWNTFSRYSGAMG